MAERRALGQHRKRGHERRWRERNRTIIDALSQLRIRGARGRWLHGLAQARAKLESERQNDVARLGYRQRERSVARACGRLALAGNRRSGVGEQDVDADGDGSRPMQGADELRHLLPRQRPVSEFGDGPVVDHHDDRLGARFLRAAESCLRVESRELQSPQPGNVDGDQVDPPNSAIVTRARPHSRRSRKRIAPISYALKSHTREEIRQS